MKCRKNRPRRCSANWWTWSPNTSRRGTAFASAASPSWRRASAQPAWDAIPRPANRSRSRPARKSTSARPRNSRKRCNGKPGYRGRSLYNPVGGERQGRRRMFVLTNDIVGQPLRNYRMACRPKRRRREGWWAVTDSNRRHPACKAGALPTELTALVHHLYRRRARPGKHSMHKAVTPGGGCLHALALAKAERLHRFEGRDLCDL